MCNIGNLRGLRRILRRHDLNPDDIRLAHEAYTSPFQQQHDNPTIVVSATSHTSLQITAS